MLIYLSFCFTIFFCLMVLFRICFSALSFRRSIIRCFWMLWFAWLRRRIFSLWIFLRRNWFRFTKWWLLDTGKDGNFWRVIKRLSNLFIYNYLYLNFWIFLIFIVKKILGFWKWFGSLYYWFFNVFKFLIY